MAPSLITRTALIDDDGSDTTGTIIDNNEIQKIYDAIDQLPSGAAPYTTFEYGGNLKVNGTLTANGIAPISGNANITGNLLVTGRLQVGGTAFGQATAPSFRLGTLSPGSQVMMEVTTGDNAAWAGVRAACFISTGSYNNLGDLTVTGGTNFAGGVNITAGNINCAGFVMSTGVVYPGRIDIGGGQQQSNWYLATHGSYGLYSNTGLFLGGVIDVGAGATFRSTVDITNHRLTRAQLHAYSEVMVGPSVPGNGYCYCDMNAANHFVVNYNQALTFVIQNPPAGVAMVVICVFGGGGAYGTGWYGTNGNGVRWPAGVAPTVTIAAGRADFFTLYTYDGGANWWGFVSGQNL